MAEYGGRRARHAARAAAQGADIVFCCVGNDDDLRSVALGADGAFAGMKPGAVFVDHTTASADVARELSAAARRAGLQLRRCAGVRRQARRHERRADGDVRRRRGRVRRGAAGGAWPSAQAVTLLGDSGAGPAGQDGQPDRIAGLVQGLSEAIAFGEKAGLDMKAVLDVIGKGAAQSWQMDNRGQTMVADKFDFGFAVDWMRKDLGLVLDEARRNGARLPVTALVDQFYADVQAAGRAALGHLEPDHAPALSAAPRGQGLAVRLRWPGRRPGLAATLGFGDDLEHAHHLLHAADAARDLGGAVGLALGDAAHQVDRAALGDHLEGVGEDVLRVDQRGLHLAGDQAVVGAVGRASCWPSPPAR